MNSPQNQHFCDVTATNNMTGSALSTAKDGPSNYAIADCSRDRL